jgi:hypothetical protein
MKRIYFGPQAQEVLRPFLQDRPLHQNLFSATEAAEAHRAMRHSLRRSRRRAKTGGRQKSRFAKRIRSHLPSREPGFDAFILIWDFEFRQ